MPRTTYLCAALLSLALAGCGDPKNAAGAIGAPVQSNESKMNKSANESKVAPQDSRAVKFTPAVPDAQQKVNPAPVDEKAQKVTPEPPIDSKIH